MSEIAIKIEDQEERFPESTTVAEVLKSLMSGKQLKQTIAVYANDKAVDLHTELVEDTVIVPIKKDSPEGLEILRHSTSHIMAQAVRDLFGEEVKIAIGPAIENGFYYDFLRDTPFSPEDFDSIEQKMAEISGQALPFSHRDISRQEAIEMFREHGEKYKVELLEEIEDDTVSIYQQGSFIDLCRGPHIPDTSWVKDFKLLRVAGAYWRGDENNDVLQRIYGTVFFDKKALKKHLNDLEEAKKRDHRRLGKELQLFTINDQIGPGLILWQPKGSQLRRLIEDYWKDEHYRHGYELLYTPHIARQDLWNTSGHLDF